MYTKYYIDTEFIERGYEKIELISIGIVSSDNREYYAVASDGWEEEHLSDWLKTNVVPHLGLSPRKTREQIKHEILEFIGRSAPEFWGYFCDYDWVLFCQLFGSMIDLPAGFPMFCRDVKQLSCDLGDIPLPKQDGVCHNALDDARHIKTMHEVLMVHQKLQG